MAEGVVAPSVRRGTFVTVLARTFAAGVATLAGCARGAKTDAGNLNAFMARSGTLTGYTDLDSGLGAAYFTIAGSSASDRDLLALWYTGINSAARATVTWQGALAWRACSFTKPPSECAVPGSWHQKP